ncbi:MAG: metallophosphoesterase family protein [Clostridiales bacterium]|jgi:putative phosphoesterase|nr:metallophosphoesterase family protein [Clostridiales bacterium]
MRIGVVSDTHIPNRARILPARLFELLDGVDMILHAGDIVEAWVLQELTALAPVEAVAGNMDPLELVNRLGRKKTLSLAGFKLGLIHGDHGSIRSKTPQRALQAFSEDDVNCVVFGHSHQPYCQKENGILLFNPGSPTDRRREPRFSCGILTLEKDIRGEILFF